MCIHLLFVGNFLADVEHALRRDLRRTKALLQDAQLMLQKNREGAGSRTTVKQLRNQVPSRTGKQNFSSELIVIIINATQFKLKQSKTILRYYYYYCLLNFRSGSDPISLLILFFLFLLIKKPNSPSFQIGLGLYILQDCSSRKYATINGVRFLIRRNTFKIVVMMSVRCSLQLACQVHVYISWSILVYLNWPFFESTAD